MRIAFNTLIQNPQAPDGSMDFYRQIIGELARQDQNNEYFVFVSTTNQHLFHVESKNVHLVNCFISNERPLLRILASQILIPYRLLQHRIDVLFSPQNISALYIPRRIRNIVAIITTHHWKTPRSIGLLRSMYRRGISYVARKQADLILANSEICKKEICENLDVDSGKVRIVYEGLDHSRFYPRVLSSEEKHELSRMGVNGRFILFVSIIWHYKNVHTLIDAYGKLCQKINPEQKLVLVGRIEMSGEGNREYFEHMMNLCDEYNIAERVKFVGYVPNEDVAKFYRSADLYVQPSMHETFGKSVVEAFGCGVPVIAAHAGASPEVVGDAAVLFDPNNSGQLAEAMEKILSDRNLRDTLVQKGLERAEHFSFSRQASELISMFEELGG
ncbi:MAG: glycosyltransferase family 4 protein [Deltaproteobacteria bacterium]|nr:glycosyltransferase family 4 protein [Deltaproteobacteria bacterium]